MNEKASEKYFHNVKQFAKGVDEVLSYSSEKISQDDRYVAWLDMMGAGYLMSTSLQKAANALARMHVAIEWARELTKFSGDLLPMNDGLFVISASKVATMKLVQQTMVFLAARFIATHADQDRFLVRGAIAYGPVVTGKQLTSGFSQRRFRENDNFVQNVYFGPPIVQAFQAERIAPPFGIAVHESARAFAEEGQVPFRMNLWLWWHKNDDGSFPPKHPPLPGLRTLLKKNLADHFGWMERNRVFLALSETKISELKDAAEQYLSAN